MSTGKLKITHLHGATSKKVCVFISQILKDTIKSFYKEHIPNLITGDDDQFFPRITEDNEDRFLPLITITNQAELIRFLRPSSDGKKISGSVYSSAPVEQFPQQKFNDFILLFNDTVRIDFECTVEKYNYKYVPRAASWIKVNIHVICLDRQKFLDSLNIEPELNVPQYVDILGKPVSVGDIICVSSMNTARLYLDKVKKLTPYSIVLENGGVIAYKSGYENKLVVCWGTTGQPHRDPDSKTRWL